MTGKNQGRAAFIALIQAASLGLQSGVAPILPGQIDNEPSGATQQGRTQFALTRLKRASVALAATRKWLE